MTRRTLALAAAPVALALALSACGRSSDASTEATEDTVEVPANEALSNVTSTPVADPNANATPTETATPEMTEDEKIKAAGDDAADTAAAAADAMDETATTEQK